MLPAVNSMSRPRAPDHSLATGSDLLLRCEPSGQGTASRQSVKLNGLFNLKSTQGGHRSPANVNIQFVSLVSRPAPVTGDWSCSVCVKIPHFTAVNPICLVIPLRQTPAYRQAQN